MKKTIATTLIASLTASLTAASFPVSAHTSERKPNPYIPGSVLLHNFSTIGEQIKHDQQAHDEFLRSTLGRAVRNFDNFVSGSSTIAWEFISDKALILTIFTGLLGEGAMHVLQNYNQNGNIIKDMLPF